jgi:hypothetical protein
VGPNLALLRLSTLFAPLRENCSWLSLWFTQRRKTKLKALRRTKIGDYRESRSGHRPRHFVLTLCDFG